VTWQPWLSKAAATNFGKILADTSTMPGLIVDALAAKSDYANEHKKEMKAFVDAYFEGIDFMAKNPEEAHEIIARNLKMSIETLEGTLNDVRFFSKQDNAAFFLGDSSPGFKLVSQAGEFYQKIGVLRSTPDAAKVVGLAGELAK
jgi:NitT/TauT family transport system substrate-binding protein